MTNKVFLDTAYAIALSVESDEHHGRAEELADQLEAESTHLVSTRAVLLEIGNALSKNVTAKPRLSFLRHSKKTRKLKSFRFQKNFTSKQSGVNPRNETSS